MKREEQTYYTLKTPDGRLMPILADYKNIVFPEAAWMPGSDFDHRDHAWLDERELKRLGYRVVKVKLVEVKPKKRVKK